MNKIIEDYIGEVSAGEIQSCGRMACAPLFCSKPSGTKYLTLAEAEMEGLLKVGEVGDHGTVPQLQVQNLGDLPILLLDGEELAGAKQNRVLNTTVLLRKKSRTVIPVSCTERGRWSQSPREAGQSGYVLASEIRAAKSRSVGRSVRQTGRFDSDQQEVWSGIDQLSETACVQSETGAMRDVYESRTEALSDYLDQFRPQPGQKGLLVMINGLIVGLDILSREEAYRSLHAKLIRSYGIDAYYCDGPLRLQPSAQSVRAFLGELANLEKHGHKSVGHGMDYRLEGRLMVGSALVYRRQVIHMAIFRKPNGDDSVDMSQMSRSSRRRRFREDSD